MPPSESARNGNCDSPATNSSFGSGSERPNSKQPTQNFRSVTGGRRSDYDGVEMGLAVCNKMVERHGGSITARSAPGNGSTFIVTLPAEREL